MRCKARKQACSALSEPVFHPRTGASSPLLSFVCAKLFFLKLLSVLAAWVAYHNARRNSSAVPPPPIPSAPSGSNSAASVPEPETPPIATLDEPASTPPPQPEQDVEMEEVRAPSPAPAMPSSEHVPPVRGERPLLERLQPVPADFCDAGAEVDLPPFGDEVPFRSPEQRFDFSKLTESEVGRVAPPWSFLLRHPLGDLGSENVSFEEKILRLRSRLYFIQCWYEAEVQRAFDLAGPEASLEFQRLHTRGEVPRPTTMAGYGGGDTPPVYPIRAVGDHPMWEELAQRFEEVLEKFFPWVGRSDEQRASENDGSYIDPGEEIPPEWDFHAMFTPWGRAEELLGRRYRPYQVRVRFSPLLLPFFFLLTCLLVSAPRRQFLAEHAV